jgi:hypothetical protein
MTMSHIDRPDCERAEAAICGYPKCGLHLMAYRRDETPICEIVMGPEQVRRLLTFIHDAGLDL